MLNACGWLRLTKCDNNKRIVISDKCVFRSILLLKLLQETCTHIQIKNRLGLHWKWIMLSNENLAGHCNTIRKKLEVLAHAIRLMYKSCNNGQRLGFPVFQLMYFFFHSWIMYSLNPLTILYFTLKMKLQLMMLFKRCSFGDTNIYMFV